MFRLLKEPIKTADFRIIATYDDIHSDSVKIRAQLKKEKEEKTQNEKARPKIKGKKRS